MPDEPSPADGQWWHAFFDGFYADVELEGRHAERVPAIVDFLVQTLRLAPGMTVFDQCCGIGRLSLPVAERGVSVVGVDLVDAYVERAAAAAAAGGLPCRFHAGDAFDYVPDLPCDGAFNWFTSFGYSDDDDVNARMIRRAAEALRPGGRYALDTTNLARLLAEFREWHVVRHPDPKGGEVTLTIEAWPDFRRGMLDNLWTFIRADGRRDERRVSTRMYLPHDLVRLFEAAGLTDVELLGSIDGEPFKRTSPRCIVVGTRTNPPRPT